MREQVVFEFQFALPSPLDRLFEGLLFDDVADTLGQGCRVAGLGEKLSDRIVINRL